MKRTITSLMLAMFSVAVFAGCEASVKTNDADRDGGSYTKKTTTVREPDGDTHTKTEVKKSNY